ncbi:unnamed protein product [Tilletia laevis]|nr:unnamed protein product [Tilletia caries]CAD6963025.1 unnamed protein product [Tilletia laevis]
MTYLTDGRGQAGRYRQEGATYHPLFHCQWRGRIGCAIKFRTEEVNLDWVFNNTPVFFLRDPAKFPHFIHTQKPCPTVQLLPKNLHAHLCFLFLSFSLLSFRFMILFGDRGIPRGHAFQHGYAGHTFKFVNASGEWVYVKIHVRSNQGVKTFTQEEGVKLAGEIPDVHNEDLFNQIEKGDFPSWTVSVQTMTEAQAEAFRYSVFDLIKIWSHTDYPLRPVGKITLNKNPENYFAEIEQVAFSPSHLFRPRIDCDNRDPDGDTPSRLVSIRRPNLPRTRPRSIFSRIRPELQPWVKASGAESIKVPLTDEIATSIDRCYFRHYASWFGGGASARTIAHIPMVNMLDDHVDGFGTYRHDSHSSSTRSVPVVTSGICSFSSSSHPPPTRIDSARSCLSHATRLHLTLA